jgi:hypothetical protein
LAAEFVKNAHNCLFSGPDTFFSQEGFFFLKIWKVAVLFWLQQMRSGETVHFFPLRAQVEECHLGGSDWFVFGEELLPVLQENLKTCMNNI